MRELARRRYAVPHVVSLTWEGDDLMDYAGGMRRFHPDGSTSLPSVGWAFPFDRVVVSPSGTYAVLYASLGTKGLVEAHGLSPELRTYKIHPGSGNILMEPNGQYLCIVRGRRTADDGAEGVYLPFEGDQGLAVILSMAFLLAEDRKIDDPTITRQIGAGGGG